MQSGLQGESVKVGEKGMYGVFAEIFGVYFSCCQQFLSCGLRLCVMRRLRGTLNLFWGV